MAGFCASGSTARMPLQPISVLCRMERSISISFCMLYHLAHSFPRKFPPIRRKTQLFFCKEGLGIDKIRESRYNIQVLLRSNWK